MMMNVIIPTLNAAKDWPGFAPALLACVAPEEVLIVDSESTDGTVELARAAGFRTHGIRRSEFNHGGTRQLAAEMSADADLLVFMTQDAVLTSPDAIPKLVATFGDPGVAAAYGRQLPRAKAGAIEAHARFFNYPDISDVRDLSARQRLGFKTIFISNSFAAYRRSALMQVGGFQSNVIFGEDTVLAARLLLANYKVAYVADACVRHSHAQSCRQEFHRYFDIGVLHNREGWLLEAFGKASGEGKRFFLSELRHLREHAPAQIPWSVLRTVLKLLGYRLGRIEGLFPTEVKRRLSLNAMYWK